LAAREYLKPFFYLPLHPLAKASKKNKPYQAYLAGVKKLKGEYILCLEAKEVRIRQLIYYAGRKF
jgi:hypothetical protein